MIHTPIPGEPIVGKPNLWRTDRWGPESLANRANAIRPYGILHHRSQSKQQVN